MLALVITANAAPAQTIPPSFFGMQETNMPLHGYPSVPVGAFRIWGVFPNVSWRDVNTSTGAFDWTNLDPLVAQYQSKGLDIIYNLAHTPAWASSNPNGACPNNPNGSCFPPQYEQRWIDFISAITIRYDGNHGHGRIKYWEIWNEPNSSAFWQGTSATFARMVTMASDAYPIIKANGGTVLSPCPQGPNAWNWMDQYLAAGGGAYAETIDFHGYMNGSHHEAEAITLLISSMTRVAAKYGQSGKPLWDTESGWGQNGDWSTENERVAWLARDRLLELAGGVGRSYWYVWDGDNSSGTDFGTLWDKVTQTITPAGTAFGELTKWTVGSTMGSCTHTGNNLYNATWTCDLTRSDGTAARAVWISSGTTASYTPPAGTYNHYWDLTGSTFALGSSVMISQSPILLYKIPVAGATIPARPQGFRFQ